MEYWGAAYKNWGVCLLCDFSILHTLSVDGNNLELNVAGLAGFPPKGWVNEQGEELQGVERKCKLQSL